MPPSELVLNGRASNRVSRSLSISSDRTSQTGYSGIVSPPLTTSPEAAFIAASAASQIVTNDHDSRADTWFDQHGIEPSGETALVAPPALKLVNRFLDQLLFGFLAVAKSTSLTALRPAVGEVLKTKLANAAIAGAEQELHEYLGGGDDDDLLSFNDGAGHANNWDLELVWKRTRLRCMVYSSLGDMEEEDEDYYTVQEQLEESGSVGSSAPGVVSPAVAIFLTSILEYMGEQILIVAGQSAYNRLRAKLEKEEKEGTNNHGDIADRVVVEELDMERVAMDRTLGRLWRGWKKRVRTPNASISLPRSFSRESMFSQSPGGTGPHATEEIIVEEARGSSVAAVLSEYEQAAAIPLPISKNDIREIEIPGLAAQSDDEDDGAETDDEDFMPSKRPTSLIFFDKLDSVEEPKSEEPIFLSIKTRTRSHSLPSPAPARYRAQHETVAAEDVDVEDVNAEDTIGEDVNEEVVAKVEDAKQEEVGAEDTNAEISETLEAPPPIQEKSKDRAVHAPLAPLAKTGGDERSKEVSQDSDSELDMPIQGARTEEPTEEVPSKDSKGITGLVASAAAIGAAAVVGVVAAVKGEAPQTDIDYESDAEEAQIMTSSRVSIGGRRSPDDTINSSASSVRAPSIHSPRVIDVPSSTRSRSGSIEAVEYVNGRPVLSRSGSLRSPIVEQIARTGSPISRGLTSSPVQRSGSALSTRQLAVEPAIAEEKEVVVVKMPNKGTPVPSEVAEAMQGVDMGTDATQEYAYDKVNDFKPAKAAAFILAQPPTSRQQRGPTSHPSEELNNHPRPQVISRSIATEHGAPLTPLRELSEVVAENEEERDSAPSSSTYSRTVRDHEYSPSGSGSTLTQIHKDHRSARIQPTVITRSSPTRSSPPREELRRTTEPLMKPIRPTHTGSTSSGNSHKLKPLRTSEDSGPTTAEDKSQSFEQLMRSDQTIQYTLTPQNMRNIESPDSPRQVMTPTIVSNGFDSRKVHPSRSRSSSNSKNLPIQSNSPIDQPRSPKLTKSPKQPQRTNSNAGTKVRQIVAQPRDARIDRESVQDIATFIRNTGPVDSTNGGPPRPLNSHRGTNGTPRNASGTVQRTSESTPLPRRAESSAGRSRLQAREAVVPRGDSISDLIDFVRSGPQLEKNDHRIPRTVAPFRSTMDSDQMVGAVGGKAIDASLPETRYSQATSINSSVNSHTALINGNSRSRVINQQPSQDFDEEPVMPKRKTRRVRDPYAIDLSDEDDDDDYEQSSKPKPIKEESLAEFLRNVQPPAESTVQPIYSVPPADIAATKIKKKSSTHSFRSRFSRKESISSAPPKQKSSSNGAEVRAPASRDAPRITHTPIAAQYATTLGNREQSSRNGTYGSQVDGARRVAQKSYEPRDAVYTNSRTNDLADFLMKSEPPPTQAQSQTFAPTLQKEEGAFQRMFGRKRVH